MEEETTTGNSGDYSITITRTYKTYNVPKLMQRSILRKLYSSCVWIHFILIVYPRIPNRDAIVYMN
jgi:hypothetical protein